MIITISNLKGGCAKTSTTILFALALSSLNKKVLVIDTDPQGGLTNLLVKKDIPQDSTLFELLIGLKQINDCTVQIKRDRLIFDLIPSNYKLDNIAPTLNPFAFKRILKKIKYDFILFDTPPTIQGISRSACIVADKIFVPSDISKISLLPTVYTLEKLKEIKKQGKVILIGYKDPDDKTGYTADLSRRFMDTVKNYYAGTIPRNIPMLKAIGNHQKKWTSKQTEKILLPILNIIFENNHDEIFSF